MKIAIASDHAGFVLKEKLREKLISDGHEVADLGTDSPASVDYPDFASAVGRRVAQGEAERGILVCSSGVGMSIAANKIPGVRAALGTHADEVELVRRHNDANVLTLGQRFTAEEEAKRLVDVFLSTGFDGGRHARRVQKIERLENEKENGNG
jgi:ribose 5-phosphate isomerase B